MRPLPPIDFTFERDEIVAAAGADAPLGSEVENFSVALVAALVAGIVIDPDVPPAIVGNVTVVAELADNVALFETCAGRDVVLLLLPPPPQPLSAVAKTTPNKTDDKRSTRSMKSAPYKAPRTGRRGGRELAALWRAS